MTDPATKLRQLRIAAGFESSAAAARRFGWNADTYKSHENGTRPISKKAAAKYANAYKVLEGWLLYDTGPRDALQQGPQELYRGELKSLPIDKDHVNNAHTGLAHRPIPRLSWEIMASVTNINQAIAEATDFYLVPADDRLPPLSFTMKIPDDSMASNGLSEDSFRRGDNAFFSPLKPVAPGDYVIARVFARNETVFRQYRESGYDKQGRKIVTLHALNANYADEDIVLGATGELIARLIRHSRDYS